MQKRDIILIEATREIERQGGAVEEMRKGKGSHRVLYWTIDGAKLVSTIPCYKGDWRSLRQARTNVRRQIREAKINEPTSV
jgi:hypothetical protein